MNHAIEIHGKYHRYDCSSKVMLVSLYSSLSFSLLVHGFFFSLRNNGTIDIDIASRMCLRMKWNGKRRSQQRMRNETRELGAFRNACTRKKSNLILSLVPWNRSSSNFVRIVGKYKGKRNGRGMAIELTRPSLAHTHIHRDILTRFP